MPQAGSTSVHECNANSNEACGNERNIDVDVKPRCSEQYSFMRRMFDEQTNDICLESVLQRKMRSQLYRCGHIFCFFGKEGQIRMLPHLLPRQMPNKPLFARLGHSLGFASVLYASYVLAYRCTPSFVRTHS